MRKSKEELIKTLKKMLTEPITSFTLWELNMQVEEMLKKLEEYKFPIDIERLAEKVGIQYIGKEICGYDCLRFRNNKAGYYSRHPNCYNNGEVIRVIEIYGTVPINSMHYQIAYAIGEHLLTEKNKVYEDLYHVGHFYTTQKEEVAKAFALTLLMPIGLLAPKVANLRKAQKDKYNGVIPMELVYKQLAEEFLVPEAYVITRYEELNRVLVEMSTFSNNEEVRRLVNKYIQLFE